MELRILGGLEVRVAADVVPVRRGYPRAVLAWLALRAPDVVAADVLIDRLWGDRPPANPTNALQTQISYLRKVLGRSAPGAEAVLATSGSGYRLELDDDAIDARRFERAVEQVQAHATPPEAGLLALEDALRLWRGDPLPEIADHPAAAGEVTRLQELRLAAVETRVDLLLELGRHAEAVSDLGSLVADHPLHERFHAQLMLALYRSGRQAEALRAFEHARQLLADELGLDVSRELRVLEGRILSHDPDLAWSAPAKPLAVDAAAPPGASSRLPVPVTALVGRDADAARVGELLGRSRLVTLTGPGGAGKTRLAIEVAQRLAGGGSEVWFVDLGGVDDDGAVGVAVAAQLQAATMPGDDVDAAVASALGDRVGVLVLDTCEHVVHGAARLVGQALRSAPGVRVLATSRRPLAVAGELAWPVPPLALPPAAPLDAAAAASPAVALFCERAAAVRPEFALTDHNAADVAAICHALDGLPLAIELAAAHADILGTASIRARLGDRFALLVGDALDAAERQRTLRATIDWSVELLADDERAFFARLSTFAGSFGLDAAAAVGEVDDALPLLRSLVRQSLVVVVRDDRFRLLDSLRAYGAELLDDVEEAATRSRLARFYAAFTDAVDRLIRGRDQQRLFAQVLEELPNLRAALEWSFGKGGDREVGTQLAASLAWMWTLRGNLVEGDKWVRLAEAEEDVPPRLRARALLGAAIVASPMGDLERTRDLCVAAADVARAAGSRGALGGALLSLGVAHWGLGELAAAAAAHDEALDLYRRHENAWGVAMAGFMRARTAIDSGDVDQAAALLEEAAAVVPAVEDRHLESLVLAQRARLALVHGDIGAALALGEETRALSEEVGYPEGVVSALHIVAWAHRTAGAAEEAGRLHRRALALATELGMPSPAIEAVEALAELAHHEGDAATAAELLSAARAERARCRLPALGPTAARLAALGAHVGEPGTLAPFDRVVARLLDG